MDYIREAIERLKDYNSLVASVKNMAEEIQALEAEKPNLKAMRLSFTPGGGSGEPDDKTVNNIFSRQVLRRNLVATQKRIECIERALESLDKVERKVIERLFIVGGKNGMEDLENELGYSRRQLYRIKDEGLRKFARTMFGVGVA